jgi:hypothetical protein
MYQFPSWLERFNGGHPQQIEKLKTDILHNVIKVETRDIEDIEIILRSTKYQIMRVILKLTEKPDRLVQIARNIIGAIARALTAQVKNLISSINV